MKYKYAMALIVSLNLGTIFSATIIGDFTETVSTDERRYQIAQKRWAAKANERFAYGIAKSDEERSNALEKYTTDVLQEEAALRELRINVISMDYAALKTEINDNSEFYKTDIGISFLYGWILNQFKLNDSDTDTAKKEIVTPFYVGKYFSFGSMFGAYLGNLDNENAKDQLSPIFETWVKNLESQPDEEKQKTKFDFLFDGIIPLHYAIEQAQKNAAHSSAAKVEAPYETPQELFRETLYSPAPSTADAILDDGTSLSPTASAVDPSSTLEEEKEKKKQTLVQKFKDEHKDLIAAIEQVGTLLKTDGTFDFIDSFPMTEDPRIHALIKTYLALFKKEDPRIIEVNITEIKKIKKKTVYTDKTQRLKVWDELYKMKDKDKNKIIVYSPRTTETIENKIKNGEPCKVRQAALQAALYVLTRKLTELQQKLNEDIAKIDVT